MAYAPEQVKEVLREIGVTVAGQTGKDWLVYCPFHSNRDTPAMTVGKYNGLYHCFNHSCDESGQLDGLVCRLTYRSLPEAIRFIAALARRDDTSVTDILSEILQEKEDFKQFPQMAVDQMVDAFWSSPEAQEYMFGRGFDESTLKHFQVGFSPKQGNLVVYPVYTPDGKNCVGVVGRSIVGKRFKNSTDLPRNRVLFNLDRARRAGGRVIVTESGFDAMRIYQAGFPCVVSLLGSSVSNEQIRLLNRNFTEAVIMTDNDSAGLATRKTLSEQLDIIDLHPRSEYGTMYPESGLDGTPPKDVGDLSIGQIQTIINNAQTAVNVILRSHEEK